MIVRVCCAWECIGINHTYGADDKQVGLRFSTTRLGDRDDPPSIIYMPEIPQQPFNIVVTQTVTVEEYNGSETMEEDDEYPLGEIIVWTGSGEAVR